MPVRKIPIGRNSITGYHAIGPGERSVGFESTLERDFVSLMLFDPNFVDIEEQPVRIDYVDDEGRKRHYTPDYLVQRHNALPLLVEIKPHKFLTAELESKFNAARSYAASQGWTFEVWTERELRTPRLKNIHFLLPFRHHKPDPGRAARLLRHIEDRGPMSVEALLDACWADENERAFGQDALWRLVASNKLQADLNRELTPQTVLHGTREAS